LLTTATQRTALDRFGAIDTDHLAEARAEVARIDDALAGLGGDERARARELDLLRFQVDELAAAAVERGDEDEQLADEQEVLADAVAHLDAAAAAVDALTGDGGAVDRLGAAVAAVGERKPFAEAERRLRDVAEELADTAADLRAAAEAIEPDPERLTAIRERRQLLRELRRKYGETLDDVLAFAAEATERLDELSTYEQRAADLDQQRVAAVSYLAEEQAAVRAARVAAAPKLAASVANTLADLAMATASVDVAVDGAAGEHVTFLLSANPGSPLQPLAKVASGGELARAMLALRLVLAGALTGVGPPTLVFDEVDAGIGGATAAAVGRALASVGADRQVLVVTHLAQVAAFASSQVTITKHQRGDTTTATAEMVSEEQRLEELARMLSGTPDSATARQHAAELLETAAAVGDPR
jgi:DNA repair protein RecN (Recombination protein N)